MSQEVIRPLQTEPHPKGPQLSINGTAWQHGSITPPASPVSESMPPPPKPQQSKGFDLMSSICSIRTKEQFLPQASKCLLSPSEVQPQDLKSATPGIQVVSTRQPEAVVARPRAPYALPASHPLLYASRHRPLPPKAKPLPIDDFPYGVVDPALNTHMTRNGPPEWRVPHAMADNDYRRTHNFVISPVFMVGLPFGGMIESANMYTTESNENSDQRQE